MASAISRQREAIVGPGFFSSPSTAPVKAATSKPAWVAVGGDAFIAIAASIIDKGLSGVRLPEITLKKILTKHFENKPTHQVGPTGLVTTQERFQYLVNGVRTAELTHELANTLRQLAAHEVNSSPQTYAIIFAKECGKNCHAINAWPDKVLMAALPRVLECSIDVQVVDTKKEIPVKIESNSSLPRIALLQQQGEVYLPRLRQTEAFKSCTTLANPVNEAVIKDEARASIMQELAVICANYQKESERLSKMIDLSREQLLAMYSNLIDRQIVNDSSKYTGTGYDVQAAFAAVKAAKFGDRPIIMKNSTGLEKDLIHSIACAVSVGQITLEAAFEAVDEQQAETRSFTPSY